jgi:hypothetical protein
LCQGNITVVINGRGTGFQVVVEFFNRRPEIRGNSWFEIIRQNPVDTPLINECFTNSIQ